MRDAVKIAIEKGRIDPLEVNIETITTEQIPDLDMRPSDIIRYCNSQELYLKDKENTKRIFERIGKYFNYFK